MARKFYVEITMSDDWDGNKQDVIDYIDFRLKFPNLMDSTVWDSLEDFLADNVLDSLAEIPVD